MLIDLVKQKLITAVNKAFPAEENEIIVTPATQEKFGHYQCNSAMKMAKVLGKNPREIASKIVENLNGDAFFAKIEIAGAGFINLTLANQFLSQGVEKLLREKRLGIGEPKKKQRIVVEFSGPNIAKEMHVGHLRSTIIGDAIARLFEFLGHDVLRLNHVGDFGTQFGMLIAYMQENASDVLEGKKAADLPSLMQWYRASKKRFDEDEKFKTRSRELVVALQSGEKNVVDAWKKICEISRIGYQEVYDLLDIKITERGESFYNPMLAPLIKDMEAKKVITVSDGAKCVFHEGFEIPLMVQKSDGGYNYDTTDMAAMKYRVENDKADRIIIVTDAGQALHFQLIYKTSVLAGYLDPKKVRFDHVTFGVVLGLDGKKFRTRAGETEKLIDLLTKGIEEASKILEERGLSLTPEERSELAHILGIDAIKYADLSNNRVGDYMFSYERMLKFEGNTATAILYSYVRVAGIKRKVQNVDMPHLIRTGEITLTHPSETDLALHLLRFEEVLHAMEEDLLPNYLTDYLYTLSGKFNAFFRDCRVEGSPEQASRLLLCEATAQVMHAGLTILGLRTVEKM